MKNWMKLLALAVIAISLFAGCARNPKLNLTGINDAPINDAGDNTNVGEPGGFDPFDTGSSNPDFQPIGGVSDAGISDDWKGSTDAMGDAAQYLLNPTRWKDKVYFAFNRSEIRPDQRPVLEALANYLQQNADECCVVEGHTDERGSDEYNRALGEHRALAAKSYLTNLGIDASRIFTLSYGEDRPAVPGATSEADYKLNRRDEFLVGKRK